MKRYCQEATSSPDIWDIWYIYIYIYNMYIWKWYRTYLKIYKSRVYLLNDCNWSVENNLYIPMNLQMNYQIENLPFVDYSCYFPKGRFNICSAQVPGYKMVNMLPSGKTPFLRLGYEKPRWRPPKNGEAQGNLYNNWLMASNLVDFFSPNWTKSWPTDSATSWAVVFGKSKEPPTAAWLGFCHRCVSLDPAVCWPQSARSSSAELEAKGPGWGWCPGYGEIL